MMSKKEEHQPFYVHCKSCEHQWVAFYVPMELIKVAEICKRQICPNCGETEVRCGKAP